MHVVMTEPFDPELHSVWGPFASAAEANRWIAQQPDQYTLFARKVESPSKEDE